MSSELARFFRKPGLSTKERTHILRKTEQVTGAKPSSLDTEVCFYVQTGAALNDAQLRNLRWLLCETFEPMNFATVSFLQPQLTSTFVEFGPRLNFSTAWSTNAVCICRECGIPVSRIEMSRRLAFFFEKAPAAEQWQSLLAALHDRMTECIYDKPLATFSLSVKPEPWFYVPVKEQGEKALEELNQKMGLAFDSWDIQYYTNLFKEKMNRNPTNVEIFDLSQSNSEHSRHWFFRGKLVIDGKEIAESLMDIVRAPLRRNPSNSVVAFNDNAGAISGFTVQSLQPMQPGQSCALEAKPVAYDITYTAETHNFPTGIAPFAGAETGTGGRIRDSHACGRGSLVVAGIAAYCVGNLYIPEYNLPWEMPEWQYPPNMATPLQIIIDASNGASDYGNKFGEPVLCGFFRSFGMQIGEERREFIKPVMFAAGIGQMDAGHRRKGEPKKGMLVVKLGGPAYRIGIGGGAASSLAQGDNKSSLDFNAVQRGDAEMEQKVNRVIRTCIELGTDNPIISIHDQGAGGNANVLKEIGEPAGARIEVRKILLGDETLSVLEIWGAEYQEADALLIDPANEAKFAEICHRERAPFATVGVVTGDGRIVLHDSVDNSCPVDMPLDVVLGKMPQKTFTSQRKKQTFASLKLPEFNSIGDALTSILDRVLRLPSVASKRFLVNKVDRSVGGLIAQQQCVGPLQLPLSDYGVIAQSYTGLTGAATAIGEQPIKGTQLNPISPRLGTRG